MQILTYNDLDISLVKDQYEKCLGYLKSGNFTAADVKKFPDSGFYRAKLDHTNRLLFKFARFEDATYILLLEVILNHDYEKSRFLRGAEVDEQKLRPLPSAKHIAQDDLSPLLFVNRESTRFHLLDKPLSFDKEQQSVLGLKPPIIMIGSAGSGKTALTLEKIKLLKGDILYVTKSPYLVENSSRLYFSYNYYNEQQEIDFLSFREFLETIKATDGKKIDFRTFNGWFQRHRQASGLKDAHKVYEEFGGVLTGMNIERPWLSRQEYLNLGVKQSIFLGSEREKVYGLFEKYLGFLKEEGVIDLNIESYHRLPLVQPKFDFIIVDEAQDLTNIQLHLILSALKDNRNFILCGDSNQIVHPNFFSWSKVKTMFYHSDLRGSEIQILKTNYRNSPEVTGIANRLLKIKSSRFGAIDKESTYLIDAVSGRKGQVELLEDNKPVKQELDAKTHRSAKFAVLVMKEEDKVEARKAFRTPLLFSVQEAKGLEYENIILFNFITQNSRSFNEVTEGVTADDVNSKEIVYSRSADKTDKALEAYKFFVNALYVAITRSVENLFVIEDNHKHRLLQLLGLAEMKSQYKMREQQSSEEEWAQEANRLEKQGKAEQAEDIRKQILNIETPGWQVYTEETLADLKAEALDPERYNKKSKDKLFSYAVIYSRQELFPELSKLKYRNAEDPERNRTAVFRKSFMGFYQDNLKGMKHLLKKYGVNYRDEFNLTPLHACALTGAWRIAQTLIGAGADTTLVANYGLNALQLALRQSHTDPNYGRLKLGKLYPMLSPDFIKIKVDGQLVKIHKQKIEFFLLNFLIALQSELMKHRKLYETKGIKMDDLLATIEQYPESVLPDYRKQRKYLLANFAKNEKNRDDRYNRKLFFRTSRGIYVLNDALEILAGEKWIPVYELMGAEDINEQSLEKDQQERIKKMIEQQKRWEQYREEREKLLREKVELEETMYYTGNEPERKEAKKRLADLEEREEQLAEQLSFDF